MKASFLFGNQTKKCFFQLSALFLIIIWGCDNAYFMQNFFMYQVVYLYNIKYIWNKKNNKKNPLLSMVKAVK